MLLDLRSLEEAAGANTYDGDIPCQSGVDASCLGPVHAVEDDSRGWVRLKRHGEAFPQRLTARTKIRRPYVPADAAVAVSGWKLGVRFGKAIATGTSTHLQSRLVPVQAGLRRAIASANASATARSMKAVSSVKRAVSSANGVANVAAMRARARVRAGTSVEVGPDLEELEFEEILLLLEVA